MAQSLSDKLKIKAGDKLFVLNAPAEFLEQLQQLPEIVKKAAAFNQVHWFVKTKAEVNAELDKVMKMLKPGALCWIYYPKGSSKIQTDLTRDKGWDAIEARNELKFLSLISFNETWSAFSMRLKDEKDDKQKAPVERAIHQYADAASKTITLPEDVRQALHKHKKENDYFEGLAFSHKKEYVEWIVSAKKDETRKQRLVQMIDKLSQKYKNPSTPGKAVK